MHFSMRPNGEKTDTLTSSPHPCKYPFSSIHTYPLTHSLTPSLTHSFTHPLSHSLSFIHSLTHSLTLTPSVSLLTDITTAKTEDSCPQARDDGELTLSRILQPQYTVLRFHFRYRCARMCVCMSVGELEVDGKVPHGRGRVRRR